MMSLDISPTFACLKNSSTQENGKYSKRHQARLSVSRAGGRQHRGAEYSPRVPAVTMVS
jgi:hypothetical protein